MKPDKYLIKQAAVLLFILAVAGYGVWKSSGQKAVTRAFTKIEIPDNELLPGRQWVTLFADSLETLFMPKAGQFFRYERGGSMVWEGVSGREKEFRQFFLNDKTGLKSVKAFKISSDPLRIEVKIDREDKGEFVTLPAEMIQSILINQ